ncbi:MAG: hypothetical protein JWN10_655 [Solirubrobacterales bacterium]|nr:hypothetical protein [Solirubrobacterales bacterium]
MSVTVEPTETPDAGVIEEARARQRRYRSLAAAGVIVAGMTAALLLGFAGGGRGSHPRNASAPAGRLPSKTARSSSAACGQARALQGAPSKSLLSILGVLRRPATDADAGSGIAARGFISGVFVHYIRLARVVDGSPYYLYPGIVGGCGTREAAHQGIMELARNVDLGHGLLGGAGGGGATAAQIEQGQDAGSGPPGTSMSSTITMVVPDGVAKVTLRYPAGPASGYSPKVSPPFTTTTAAVDNLVVVSVPRSNPLQQGTMIWRAANGHTIKRFDGVH